VHIIIFFIFTQQRSEGRTEFYSLHFGNTGSFPKSHALMSLQPFTEIDNNNLKRWLQKSMDIQWDYKNLVKRKGRLEKLHLQGGMPLNATLQNLAQ